MYSDKGSKLLVIVTNKQDYTADYLILRLHQRGIKFIRFNTEDFPTNISISLNLANSERGEAFFEVYGVRIDFEDISSVWYRRPLQPVPSDKIEDDIGQEFVVVESQHVLQAVWRLLDCTWVNNPDKLQIAESKPYQLMLASKLGFVIPDTLITNKPDDASNFINQTTNVVYKPMRYGRIYRESESSIGLIYTNKLEAKQLSNLETVQYAPSLFQRYIEKHLELRITVVGTRVFTVALESQNSEKSRHDWRRQDTSHLVHKPFPLPTDIEDKCIALVRTLGLNFGAIDMILTPDKQFVFLEINPNGQWAWLEQTLPELQIADALIDLLTEG